MQLGLPHSSIVGILWCVCIHPINPMGIHFLCHVHGNECTKIHDPIHNTFVAIAWNVGFHVGQKQLHVFPSTTFNSFHPRINIVFTKDGIYTLVNVVVIVDPTWIDLLIWSCATQGFKLPLMQLKSKKGAITTNTPLINSSI
jgi:hypothetical protein